MTNDVGADFSVDIEVTITVLGFMVVNVFLKTNIVYADFSVSRVLVEIKTGLLKFRRRLLKVETYLNLCFVYDSFFQKFFFNQ